MYILNCTCFTFLHINSVKKIYKQNLMRLVILKRQQRVEFKIIHKNKANRFTHKTINKETKYNYK